MGVVIAAIAVWIILACTWLVFVFQRAPHHQALQAAPAPEPSHVASPGVTPDLIKSIAEIISASHKGTADVMIASHQNLPTLIVATAAVLIVGIFAWMIVRIDANRARRSAPPYQYLEPRLEDRREEHRGDLVVRKEDNPFEDWRGRS